VPPAVPLVQSTLPAPPRPPARRNDLLIAGGATLFVVLGLITMALLRRGPEPVPATPQQVAQVLPGSNAAPTSGVTSPQQQALPPIVPLETPPAADPAPSEPVTTPAGKVTPPATRKPSEPAKPAAKPPAEQPAPAPAQPRVETPPPPPPPQQQPVQVASSAPAPEVKKEPEAAAVHVNRPATLRAIRRLYVEKMKDDLDVYIREELKRQMPALKVVARKADADSVMRGASEKDEDVAATATRGYLGIKSSVKGSVRVTDIDGVHLLWSGEAGDNRAIIGAIKRGGPKLVAERLVRNLRESFEQ
jgi:hypothetical protein